MLSESSESSELSESSESSESYDSSKVLKPSSSIISSVILKFIMAGVEAKISINSAFSVHYFKTLIKYYNNGHLCTSSISVIDDSYVIIVDYELYSNISPYILILFLEILKIGNAECKGELIYSHSKYKEEKVLQLNELVKALGGVSDTIIGLNHILSGSI